MAPRFRGRRRLAALLLLDLLRPPQAALALPTDGSTLAASRGGVPAEGAPSGQVQPELWTGAATTSVPIALPPGTGGLTPELTLRYASASRADSWVGFGWSLGLSSISRSLARGTPRYDDAADVLELDGERLVRDATLPGRYRTERESFVRIAREGDGSFTLRRRDGVALRYGTRPDARITDAGGRVFEWLLTEMEDPHGNVVVATYDRTDAGTAYLAEIRYTLRRRSDGGLASLDGDPARDRVVRFVLEPRPDAPQSSAAGFRRVLGRRLAAVEIRAAGLLVRRYRLRYAQSPDSGRSLLESVALHGTDADSATPTPPLVTRFAYRSNVASGRARWERDPAWSNGWPAALSLVQADRQDGGVRLADVDGDGRPDLVKAFGVVPTNGGDVVRSADSGVRLNTGSGFESSPNAAWPLPAFTGVLGNRIPLIFAAQVPDGNTWGNGVLLQDVTGDGRADLFGAVGFATIVPPLTQSYQSEWCRGTASGFSCQPFADTYRDGTLFTGKQALGLETQPLRGVFLFADGNTQPADLDGDGLPELVVRGADVFNGVACAHSSIQSYVVHNDGDLRFRLGTLEPMPPGITGCATESVSFGRDWQPCDVRTQPGCAARLPSATSRWALDLQLGSGSWLLAGHQQMGNVAVDVDADGLADWVSSTGLAGQDVRAVQINDGARGFIEAPSWRLPVWLQIVDPPAPGDTLSGGRSRDTGVRFADVNGDGRLDVVIAWQGGFPAAGTWLNDGDADEGTAPSPWNAAPAGVYTLPPELAFVDAEGRDLGLRFVDVDGDGMTDLVRSFGGVNEVYRHQGVVPDLLEQVTSPYGGIARLDYAPSTRFDHGGDDGLPDLPQVLPLLVAVDTRDGVGAPARTTFAYRGGRYDAAERTLRGFREVTSTSPDGRTTRTRFHQDPARAGLIERVERRAAGGALWEELAHEYTADDDGLAPFKTLPTATTHLAWDGSAVPRRTRVEQRWDTSGPSATGLLRSRSELGEVDAAGRDLDPGDTLTTELTYTPPNPALHLVDRVARRLVHAGPPGAAAPVRETRFFYDGDATGTAPLRRGLLTMRRDLANEAGLVDPETRFAWDPYGNLVSVASPRAAAGQGGGTTRFEHDAVFHTFRTAVVSGLGQRSESSYGADASCAIAIPAGAGLVQVERGPNDLVSGGRLVRCHDAFGRVVLERAPHDLAETRWSYDDTPGASRVTTFERADAGGGVRSQVTLLDGFGRQIASRSSGPQGRTVLRTWTFDANGRVASESGPDFEGDPLRRTAYRYDPLDRRVETTYPGVGRVWRGDVTRDLVTLRDPTGHVVRRRLDAWGRIVAVEEESDGGTLVSRFRYTPWGELAEARDARGNATLVVYDLLGRRRLLVDPDAGAFVFVHDAAGNVVSRAGALGVVTWRFDAHDRPTERRVNGVLDARWSWDTSILGLGRLAAREDGAGRHEVLSYDALGRPMVEIERREGRLFHFLTLYDPLGQPASRTFPSSQQLTWQRDAAGHLVAVRVDGANVATGIEWDASGRLARFVAGNGLTSEMRYGAADARLAELALRAGTSAAVQLRWRYDAADRPLGIDDLRDATQNRSFAYDALGRLVAATGPYGPGGARADLHYAYDALGSLVCKDASAAESCAGGLGFVYPATAGATRPRAPLQVGGVAAQHDAAGNLTALGDRGFVYDALGRLVATTQAGVARSLHVFDGDDRRARRIEGSGPRAVTTHFIAPDFEWDETRRLAHVQVALAGLPIATATAPLEPLASGTASGVARRAPPFPARGLAALALAPLALGAGLLARELARRRRAGVSIARPAAAGLLGLVLPLLLLRSAHGAPDGDLNGDRRLDAADALLVFEIARGARAPTAEERAAGDVAPLELAPESPPRIDLGDAVLLLRALRGDDVDGDGLGNAEEAAHGASPFRADTDRDGVSDPQEIAGGSDPARTDSDGDGLSDGAERAAGSDPTSADTDGDGFADGADPRPRAGILWRFPDALGTPVALARTDGVVIARPLLRPFGDAVPGAPSGSLRELGFTGRRLDASGLHDYGARFYDAALGRFLQPDALVPEPLDPQSWNRYAYVRQDPLRRIDPSGHASFAATLFGAVLGGLGSGLADSGQDRGVRNFLVAVGNFATGSGGLSLAWGGEGGLQARFGLSDPVSIFADGFRRKISAPTEAALRMLSVSDLRFGQFLLTRDGGLAKGIARVPGMDGYGHAAFVLTPGDYRIEVLSADNRGRYVEGNDDPAVGGRMWDVFSTGERLSTRRVDAWLKDKVENGELGGGLPDYLGDAGAHVCSSFAVEAYRTAGGERIPRSRYGDLVTPGDISRAIGPPIGRVYIPPYYEFRRAPSGP